MKYFVYVLAILIGLISNQVGYYFGYREAVRTDYKRCAEAIHERAVANMDATANSPVDEDAWCAAHGDSVYGNKRWRPASVAKLKNPYETP